MKHNYTNELELKSILIRIKNARITNNTVHTAKTICVETKENTIKNRRIDKYIRWYKTKNKKNKDFQERLKQKIIRLSEETCVNKVNYEKFGEIIMEMVRHILTKSQFRGYSYYDDFMSDSVYKILKYLDNFDHTKKSEISGQYVNAFAYLSTIIHNAVVYIIKKKKREQLFIQEQINNERSALGLPITDYTLYDKPQTKTVRLEEWDSLNDCIEEHEDFTKNNILIIEHTRNLEIEEIAEIQKIKKKNKNIRFNEVEV